MSLNKKICGECGTEMTWLLDENQKPLLDKSTKHRGDNERLCDSVG